MNGRLTRASKLWDVKVNDTFVVKQVNSVLVHSFDPGMYDEPEHAKHTENILFHRWGIDEVDSDALYQRAMRDYAYRKKYGDKKLEELRKWKVDLYESMCTSISRI